MSNGQIFLLVNLIGGTTVIGSYVFSIAFFPEHRESFWGGIDGNLRRVFTISMVPAAVGYLIFACFMVSKSEVLEFNQDDLINGYAPIILSVIFLIASTVWMPTLALYLDSNQPIWWHISLTSLWITALTLMILTVFAGAKFATVPTTEGLLAIIGLIYITFHCTILDAIIWRSKFPTIH